MAGGTTTTDSSQILFNSALLYWDVPAPTGTLATYLTSIQDKELGLSENGVTVNLETEKYFTQLANFNGAEVADMGKITKWSVSVEGEIKVLNKNVYNMSLLKDVTTPSITSTAELEGEIGAISANQYKSLLMIGTATDSNNVETKTMIYINKTFNESLSIETKSGEDGIAKISFKNHPTREELKNRKSGFRIIKEPIVGV